jgi:acyl-CoA thioesterase FadM
MTNWTETYRGTVPPWQCDVTEHFTIAYYFDRLEESEANLADELGLSDLSRRADLVRRMDVRFARELRKGASFHVESAALGVDTDGIRVGHRFVDSANGEVVTWFDERWDAALTWATRRGRGAARGVERAGGGATHRAGRNRRVYSERAGAG